METHVTFLDLKKAFDTVNRIMLLKILQNEIIPQQIIQNICNLYRTNLIGLKLKMKNQNGK
jgi:hypothetical protein